MTSEETVQPDVSVHAELTRPNQFSDGKPLLIRPYARLLTMLGEQLLKNERVALVELIKNSYDADAGRVDVRFERFGEGMKTEPASRIVIGDNGCGMTLETVRKTWMNPATPAKYLNKQRGKMKTPKKHRVIQGEKGIGRFAMLKLAKKISLITRSVGASRETVVLHDFTRFDDDFVKKDGQEKEIFLDELRIEWLEREPETLTGNTHGTVIEMESLKGEWSENLINMLSSDVAKLTDPVSRLTRKRTKDKFEISIFCDGRQQNVSDAHNENLKSLIEDKRVFAITGQYVDKGCRYQFDMGEGRKQVRLNDKKIMGLWIWRKRYKSYLGKDVAIHQTYKCGDFAFQFYIFDFARGIEGRYELTQEQKNLLKGHRIYLYRDGMRVYPYGEPDDDWLNIDVTRGTGRAGNFFSNDQLIGWIDISQEENPRLRDKTNREGLIETGGEADDFTFLIRTFLSFVKQYPFGHYQQRQRRQKLAKSVRDGVVTEHLADLKRFLEAVGETGRAMEVSKIESEYRRERDVLVHRVEMTEDLAGVGLSVELASHDIMLLMGRAQDIGLKLARHARDTFIKVMQEQADMLVGVLQQIVSGMRDVQSLFKSSRRRRQVLKVEPILDKIYAIYGGLLDKLDISYRKSVVGTAPLVANTTDGVVMQVLINLFDNAAYWIDTNGPARLREIRVTLDSDRGELRFEDSGPGIDSGDRPYIFDPFFSGKGQEGRGLGLYIARQLLERHRYVIDLDDLTGALDGATFVVNFMRENE